MLAFCQKSLVAPQPLLRCFALRDVAQVAGEGRRPVQRDSGDRDLDGEFAAVGAHRVISTRLPIESRLAGGQVSGQSLSMSSPEATEG